MTDLFDRLKELYRCWRDVAIELYQRFAQAFREIKQIIESMPLWEADIRNHILRKAKYLRRMSYNKRHRRKRKKPLHRRKHRRKRK